MTVCIAALCDDGKNAVGMTDSMMTINNIETESVQKAISISRTVIALLSGDVDLNTEILYRLREIIGEYDADKMIPYEHNVKDIAELYHNLYLQIRSERVEKEIMSSYRVDLDTWNNRQQSLSTEVVRDIINRTEYFEMPKIEVIIMGADKSLGDEANAHIFIVRNQEVVCRDLIGYACVGVGGEQAELELIQRNHSPKQLFEQAALTVSLAKSRAEKVAGVGSHSKIVFVFDEESELAKSGVLMNGVLLEAIEILEFSKTLSEMSIDIKLRNYMTTFRDCVKNNKLDVLASKQKEMMESAYKTALELEKRTQAIRVLINEKPKLEE